MATNTAGNFGYRKSDIYGPQVFVKKILYSDWVGTNNDAHVVGYLPPYAALVASQCHVIVKTAFDDTTGDDLDIGISGGDDDWFASGLDLNTGSGVLLTFDDLTDTERYSASARTVTCNFTTAPTGNGTTGEVWIVVGYYVLSP